MAASKRKQKLMGEVAPGPEVEDFANALDTCLAPGLSLPDKRARILDLPRKYHENAIRRLAQKRPNRPRRGADDMEMDVDADDQDHDHDKNGDASGKTDELRQLEKEVETWDLIRRLLPLRYYGSGVEPMRFPSPFSASKPPMHDHVNDFLEGNRLALERRAVLQWLQTNAAAGPDINELVRDLQQNADRGDIIAHGWLHTRSKIKLRKSVTAWPHLLDRQSPNVTATHVNSDGAPLVTHLDPDTPTRQGRKLEPQDDYFERAIWLGCFEHLRRGSKFGDIRDWCQERTEMWRAMSMSAMSLSVDDGQDPETGADPASLALWRRMCFSLARQGGSDDFERATYGILSGDIVTVEKVARTWDDYLFANYNALLRSQIDTYMLSKCSSGVVSALVQSFSAFDAVQFHGDDDDVEKRLIQTIGSNPRVEAEAGEPNKALQASFIAKELDRHLFEQGAVLTAAANEFSKSRLVRKGLEEEESTVAKHKYFDLAQHSGLRIVAHVFVLVSLLDRFEMQELDSSQQKTPASWRFSQENILASYTDYLRRCKLQELIPLYCSVLNSPRCYEVLSWNVIEEPNAEKRLTQLRLIRRAGIDVLAFVETQANLLFNELDSDAGRVVSKDSFRILEEETPSYPIGRGRRIKLDFFACDEDKVDARDVHVIRALEWLLLVEETWPKVFSMGTKVYKLFLRHGRLGAARVLLGKVGFAGIMQHMAENEEQELGLYDDVEFWAQQLAQSGIRDVRPEQVMSDARNYRELEALVKALNSLETVASLVDISGDAGNAKKEFRDGLKNEVDAAVENMQSLLKSWLLSGIKSGDDELKQLREAYLPETVLAYVSVLHFAGTSLSVDYLLESMELAAVAAARNSDVAEAFAGAGRMTELVEAFTACSKALAIVTEEKRVLGFGKSKMRERGWSRDLWAVQH